MFVSGHVKRNPVTGAVAVRNHFPDDDPDFAGLLWAVVSPRVGARNASTAEVAEWDDLYVPTSEDGS